MFFTISAGVVLLEMCARLTLTSAISSGRAGTVQLVWNCSQADIPVIV